MGLTLTLNGHTCTDVRCTIPAWGASYHDVAVDGEVTLTGAVTLVVADLTIQGTVLSGGPATGRSYYRIVSGAAGWAKSLPRKSYANDAGVKLSTVLQDAATAAGETLDATTVPSSTVGLSYTRPAGLAARVLQLLSPGSWYVGEDGKTRLGQRAVSPLKTPTTPTTQIDLAQRTVTLSSLDTIAAILPGVTVNGIEAVDVEHTASLKDGLRSKIWGRKGAAGNSRRLAAYQAIFDQLDPGRQFRGIFEYRIQAQVGERLMLQAVRVSSGMPDLQRVYVRPGLPGCKAEHKLGARVTVGFIDQDPGRPAVLNYEDADGAGFLPQALKLAGGGSAIARVGDAVTITQAQLTDAGASANGSPVTVTSPVTAKISTGSALVSSG
jgi:hypothetical protein